MTKNAFDPRIILWNETAVPRDPKKTIYDLLSNVVQTQGDKTAIIDVASGDSFTYTAYFNNAQRLAGFIAERLGKAPQRVAYIGRRSQAAIVGLTAIMVAGHAYVPIDPSWPRKRQLYVLKSLAIRGLVHDDENFPLACALAGNLGDALTLINAGEADLNNSVPEAILTLWDGIVDNDDLAMASGFNQRSDDFVPPAQIEAYADHVYRLAASNGPAQNILEIGCGPGLVLRRLIAAGHICTGIDPSARALASLQNWATSQGHNPTLITAFADDIKDLSLETFDTILLSSCIQFFPSYDYLDRVLASLPQLLKPKGSIVLADLVPDTADRKKGHLTLTPDILNAMLEHRTELTIREVQSRDDRVFGFPLANRWDAILHHAPDKNTSAQQFLSFSRRNWEQAPPLLNPLVGLDSEAYVIFTSGTTGVPKGVSVSHRAVVNLIQWARESFRLPDPLNSLFTTSLGFDLSVFDMFGILALGGCIRVTRDTHPFEPELFARQLADAPITLWDSAPAVLTSVLPFLKDCKVFWPERPLLVMLSGDWIPLNTLSEIRAIFPNAHLLALGGATEATVWSNAFHVDAIDPSWSSIPYGTPMSNARYYVLNKAGLICPIGVEGDLFIAGTCVANGYATDADLTQQKFLPDPWWTGPDARMYATGDRAVWQPDGWLEFRGRMDDQVQISGYRIELGEVSAALSEVDGVRDHFICAVGEDQARHLAACVLSEKAIDSEAIRQVLRSHLPHHMIPTRIEVLTQFPVNATGKTDRKALQDILSSPAKLHGNEASHKRNPLALIWEDVLGKPLLREDENFFAVGGHSLLAAQITHRVHADLGVELELREVFLHPVFCELSALVDQRCKGKSDS